MEITLRKWRMSDVPFVAKYADNYHIAQYLRDVFPHPYTVEAAKAYVQSCVADSEQRQCCRAIVVDGETVGSIGVFLQQDVYRCNGELGYWLAEPFWGRGIMTRAVRELCAVAFTQYNLLRIYAEPFSENVGSRRVLEKSGFTLEGVLRNSVVKNGRVQDSCIYSLLREEF